MKTIFGFIAVVFSVLLFVPTGGGISKSEQNIHIDLTPKEINYTPSKEVLESRSKLLECERKIKDNLTYLNSANETK